jgi:hypothetical protein
VPRARLQPLPRAVGLGAGDDPQQPAGDAVDALCLRRDGGAAVLVERDGEPRAPGGGAQCGGHRGVELAAVVGEQERAQVLAQRDRAREVVVAERLAGESSLAQPRGQRLG